MRLEIRQKATESRIPSETTSPSQDDNYSTQLGRNPFTIEIWGDANTFEQ